MREIKFRAIRKGSKEFLFGDLVHNCEGDAIFPRVLDDNALLNSPDYYTINPETIGQFTGLRDKNGIGNICFYEGDIIDLYGKLIGNKYESPDLLKNKTNLLIEGIGTKNWRTTEKKALARGLGYSE